MYIGRHKDSVVQSGSALPNEWTEAFTRVLTESYFKQSEKDNRFFDVYGKIFDNEFVVIISYIHHTDQLTSPISIFISHDTVEDSKKMKKTLDDTTNLAAHILDDIFSVESWSDYNPNWTENNFNKNTCLLICLIVY